MRIGSLLGVLFCVGIVGAQQSSTVHQTRKFYYAPGQSVLDQLRQSGGTSAEVIQVGAPPLIWLADDLTETELNTRHADLVAIVRVVDKKGIFTPAADWVNSEVSATVVDVLKDASGKIREGAALQFSESGGEAFHEHRRVRASLSWQQPFVVGKAYLIYATFVGSGRIAVDDTAAYEVVGEQLVSLEESGEQPSSVRSFGETVKEIRSKAHLPRRSPR